MNLSCSVAAVSIHTLSLTGLYALVVTEGVIKKTKKITLKWKSPNIIEAV